METKNIKNEWIHFGVNKDGKDGKEGKDGKDGSDGNEGGGLAPTLSTSSILSSVPAYLF